LRIDAAVAAARRRLSSAGVPTAGLDARVLARVAFGFSAVDLIVRGGEDARPEALAVLDGFVDRRAAGEPVGRILGRREFHGLEFVLSPDTLEPRPDTETLVDVAVGAVRSGTIPGVGPDGEGLTFADLGTGSGAVAVAIARALPRARGVATDISAGAMRTAAVNARRHGVADRLDFVTGDWLEPLRGDHGLIVSNPPYIESAAVPTLPVEVRDHDPARALDGGADGLDAYRAILGGVVARLAPGGVVAVEVGSTQAAAVRALMEAGGLVDVTVHTDIEGRDRVVAGRFRPGVQVSLTFVV
jgi:release factor glutamine methyltransferase